MGLREAKKYIKELHKRQSNPFLWPDYLTGLPDRAAVLHKVEDFFPRLGKYAIAYIRIANIEPYLLKYGYDHHAEIIQWAAAILKTIASEIRGSFVGKVATHEFVFIAPSKRIQEAIKKANSLFKRKSVQWYSENDREKGFILNFENDHGRKIRVGLLKFVASVVDKPVNIERMELIPEMQRLCREAERKGILIKNLS
jgi:GGDEF domain-containing protein